MINLTDTLAAIERRATERGIEMSDVLATAGIHRTTWERWRAGSHLPSMRKLMAVQQAVENAEPKQAA